MSEWRIPLSDLDYGPEEEAAVLRVLRSRWLSMGPEVQVFEREFAEFIGVRHAFAVANGTAALHLAYVALGLGPGDEIIQPAINFVAAANMTVAVGAIPVFADVVSLEEPTIDPADIERRISERTRAVVVMHYGGYPCRMADITAMCRKHNLALIEDACHALGARSEEARNRPPHGRMVGALGDVACFSFFSNKNMAVGEGGMVVTDRDDLAERLQRLRSHGMTTLTWDRHKGHASAYDVICHGYNYRSDEIRAALGRVQLAKLLTNNGRRRQHVSSYRQMLDGDLADWVIPFEAFNGSSAGHLMVAVAPDVTARERAAGALRQAGIQTSLHYPCVADFKAFRTSPEDALQISRAFASSAITLPLYPGMTSGLVEEVCQALRATANDSHRFEQAFT